MSSLLRLHRERAGLTQSELAATAGVSRQLVGAVEAGRHLPRVDAALALAAALGVDVRHLFGIDLAPLDVISGRLPADGTVVRVGRVGEQPVTAPARIGPEGWGVGDAVVENGALTALGPQRAGLVVAGCEPGLEILEQLLREIGVGGLAAGGSSATALAALAGGRVHGAVVHGPDLDSTDPPAGLAVTRFRLTRWQVGLAAPPEAGRNWWKAALSGTEAVVQREQGARVQAAFEAALQGPGPTPGPRVGTHLEAVRRSLATGLAAVTIEPAALALGAAFHPLEVHDTQLWIADEWMGEPSVTTALELLTGQRFSRRLLGIGGYDLDGCGTRAA